MVSLEEIFQLIRYRFSVIIVIVKQQGKITCPLKLNVNAEGLIGPFIVENHALFDPFFVENRALFDPFFLENHALFGGNFLPKIWHEEEIKFLLP